MSYETKNGSGTKNFTLKQNQTVNSNKTTVALLFCQHFIMMEENNIHGVLMTSFASNRLFRISEFLRSFQVLSVMAVFTPFLDTAIRPEKNQKKKSGS